MEWWREMFASPMWQGVQLSWEEADDADGEAEQVVRALDLRAGARVLDVPCGTGRIARRLRARGCEVVGIDAIEPFVWAARDGGLPSIRADMRSSVTRAGTFDAVVCLWGSFGYFDDDGNLAQARAAADALKPGGRYLVDLHVADSVLPGFVPTAEWEVAGTHVDEVRRYDEATHRIETTWTFTRDDVREVRVTSVRLYSVAELTDLFQEAGFVAFQALDGELAPFEAGADRLWLVASVGD
jgi:SAM-dependent methyltransferase